MKKEIISYGNLAIPKMCNTIGFSVNEHKDIILTLSFKEETQEILIDRVVITPAHMRDLFKTIKEIIDDPKFIEH